MRMPQSVLKFLIFPAFAVLALYGLPSFAEAVLTTQQASGVSVSNVQVVGAQVQGEIVNQTADTVLSAELLVRHHWLWADEMHPGEDDPGWVDVYPLIVSIEPGGSAPFQLQSSRIAPQRSDGTLQTDVSISRFETVPKQ
jgi:hypothetical protein